MKKTIQLASILSLSLGLSAIATAETGEHQCDSKKEAAAEEKAGAPTKAAEEQTLVEIAAGNEDFSTLVAAVKAAGLAEALSGDGPFTIFAPTNEAFEKLPEGTLEDLLKPENKEKLAAVLKYHVVGQKVMAADVKAGEVPTLEGTTLEVKVADGKVMVDNANVIKTDIVGKNGVIHVIDSVIILTKRVMTP